MLFKDLKNKTIAVFGMGKEGSAVLHRLNVLFPEKKIGIIQEDNARDCSLYDVIFKSPGVSLYHQEIVKAAQKGCVITSGLNLYLANKKAGVTTIGITGTKGKSTTSALTAHLLKAFGFKTGLGGNYGIPAIEFVDRDLDYFVIEVSSYQAANLAYDFDEALVLNLYPEHFDWHRSHEQYYKDKLNILNHAKLCYGNFSDKTLPLYLENRPVRFFNTPDGVHFENGWFMKGKCLLFSAEGVRLKGEHNLSDICAALSLLDGLGVDIKDKRCEEAVKSFESLPHRLQTIYETADSRLKFVDDSISTIPQTAVMALKAFDGVPRLLIAGGLDRKQDFTPLVMYLKEHDVKLVTLPDTGERLYEQAIKAGVTAQKATTMEQAVKLSCQLLHKGIVLLSPASPSYNMYKDFQARGEDFKKCVFLLFSDDNHDKNLLQL
jgi:UDP-N-acetylmuramoyl-L-alanine---L-glutamate ligase